MSERRPDDEATQGVANSVELVGKRKARTADVGETSLPAAKRAEPQEEREPPAGMNQVERTGARRTDGTADREPELNWPTPKARAQQGPEAAAPEVKQGAPKQETEPPAIRLNWAGSVAERFHHVPKAWGADYEWRDQPGRVAFRDRGSALHSDVEAAPVVKGMLDLAAERGWSSVQLRGSPEFVRQAWIAAEARGIKAKGYEPSLEDRKAAEAERNRLLSSREALQPRAQERTAANPAPAIGAEALKAFDLHLAKAGLDGVARERFAALARQELASMAERGKTVGVPLVDKASDATRGAPAPSYAYKPPIKELSR